MQQSFPASTLRRTIRYKDYTARLYDLNFGTIGGPLILYKFVLIAEPHDPKGARMLLASETNSSLGKREAFFMRYFSHVGAGAGHANYGAGPDWVDERKFLARAKDFLGEPVSERAARPWWRFW